AVPRLIAAEEWATVSAGVAQRVRTLEHLLDDLYTDQRVIVDGVVPRQLISSSSYLVEAMRGDRPPNGVGVHITGIVLVRGAARACRGLAHHARSARCVTSVLSSRRAMAQTSPQLSSDRPVPRVGAYPGRLLAALRAAAPGGAPEEPTVVVLTPGRYTSAY